jgi:ABC-type polysaccharide/polyol phosphate export permease
MQNLEVSESSPPLSLPRRGVVRSPKAMACHDLMKGLGRWWVWSLLAWYDIKKRYRGSVLGPFWLTLTTAVTIGSIGLLNSQVMGVPLDNYMPYLGLGMIVWGLISSLVNDSATAFTSVESVIKQIKMPISTQVYRNIVRNFIVFAHNLPVIFIVAIACHLPLTWSDLLVIPGLVLLILWIVPLSLLLGSICARFRDVPQMITSILQLSFFLSPIMWRPEMLGAHADLALLNPFSSFLDIIRYPLLGRNPNPASWLICGGCLVVTWAISFPFFARFRARIAYWT